MRCPMSDVRCLIVVSEGTLSRGCLKTSHKHSSGIESWPRFQIAETVAHCDMDT